MWEVFFDSKQTQRIIRRKKEIEDKHLQIDDLPRSLATVVKLIKLCSCNSFTNKI